ncbi:hypothetical protein [Neisseria weixii]|uniref:hypothetical protein n=1 Tax=Neisseria weixii TaxID=1853276 RepID=UPI0035A12CBF
MLLSIIWFFTDYNRLEPLTILFGGVASLANFIYPKPNYGNKRVKGRDSFDYSSNSGLFHIGKEDFLFTTMWTKASDVSIYLYKDPENISKIAIAEGAFNFKDIRNPDVFDFSSRSRTIEEGQIAVLVNKNGYYCLIKIIDIKDKTRADDRDEITIEWVINPYKEKDFS